MEMVDPWVVHNILQAQVVMDAGEPANAAEADSTAAALEVSKQALRTQLTAHQVVFLPIIFAGHWALLTVTMGKHDVRHLEWRDSRTEECMRCRAAASWILAECF
eukprot:13532705-Heterocapsa_arctica.AAC.1